MATQESCQWSWTCMRMWAAVCCCDSDGVALRRKLAPMLRLRSVTNYGEVRRGRARHRRLRSHRR